MNNNEFNSAVKALNHAKEDVKGFVKGAKFDGARNGAEAHGYEWDSLEGEIYMAIFMAHLGDRFPEGVKTDGDRIIL